ncbi:ABC transporter substrate-binding protein [Bordetella sp. N]|uniref:ABC transporter substrate-binding protein n=1 Tax=Bordetella sp. N TaxID=1746199 RepID=UPI0018D21526|nr:ABC transporter substrate-binding protein [Bordetella sp. N]
MTSTSTVIASTAFLSGLPEEVFAATGHLRIAMTSADIPTTTGVPNNGSEGMRFLGYPVFEPLVDWDLRNASDKRAGIRPALAESWSIDANDKNVWTFKLRKGVKFHDGSPVDADAIVWNFARIYDDKAAHFDQAASAIARARVPTVKAWKKVDDMTVQLITDSPTSYFLYQIVWVPMVSKARYEEVKSWSAFAAKPAGSGPFKITRISPRVSVELAANKDYWDTARIPKVSKLSLFPMSEATTRLAALRSGQVDWIEVPPPDTIPSLKSAGFQISTKIYPHIWPWVFSVQPGSPFADKRVRQAMNWAIDRAALVSMLNDTALPAKGFVVDTDAQFGKPNAKYGYDPEKAKALLKEAGYDASKPLSFKVMISTSGSGQMVPIPMNELLQQTLAKIGVKVSFETVEWGTMLVAFRQKPDSTAGMGCHAMNISLMWSDPSVWRRYFHSAAATPREQNWGQWSNPQYDALMDKVRETFDDAEVDKLLAQAHEILVDESPWLYIVHDLNPRALAKNVSGFTPAQSWMQDFTPVVVA